MDGECTVNDEPQKRFTEMANEIEVTRYVCMYNLQLRSSQLQWFVKTFE